MNLTMLVLETSSLGPAKFYLYMMLYLTAIIWWSARRDA